MKVIKPVLLLLFLSSTFSMSAQDNAIAKYFSEHLSNPDFDQFKVSQASFEQIGKMESDDFEEQQVLDALGDLEGALVLVNEKAKNATAMYYDAIDQLEADGNYEELMSVKHESDNVQILIREELDEIREFLLVVGGHEHFVLASLYGEIDLSTIMRFGKVLKKESKVWFELVDEENTKELKFNQNPSGGTTLTIEKNQLAFDQVKVFPNVVQDQVKIENKGATDESFQLSFFTLLGEPVQEMGKVTLPYTLQLNDLPSGAYFIRLTNSNGAYKNFRIVKP